MAKKPDNQPVNMRVKLFSQICEDAERDALQPGEVKPKESYPVYNFSGREFWESRDGKVRGRP